MHGLYVCVYMACFCLMFFPVKRKQILGITSSEISLCGNEETDRFSVHVSKYQLELDHYLEAILLVCCGISWWVRTPLAFPKNILLNKQLNVFLLGLDIARNHGQFSLNSLWGGMQITSFVYSDSLPCIHYLQQILMWWKINCNHKFYWYLWIHFVPLLVLLFEFSSWFKGMFDR